MPISYPLALPTINSPSSITMRARTAVAGTRSPFSGARQVQKHQAQWWEAEITLPPMLRADADVWNAFLIKLNGLEGTFLMGDPSSTTAKGSASVTPGTPIVNGADQLGNTLNIDGCPNNVTNYLKAGDYIQLGTGEDSRLFKVLDDASSNGSGEIALVIWPELNARNQPSDGATVVVDNAVGTWSLSNNSVDWNVEPLIYGMSFPALMVL